jgi:hypothetical protein
MFKLLHKNPLEISPGDPKKKTLRVISNEEAIFYWGLLWEV